MQRYKPTASRFFDLLWILALVGLPVTSFPLFIRLTGGAQVAPLSTLPVILIFLFWFLPYVYHRGKVPREGFLLVVFFLVVLVSAAGAYFIDVPSFKGKTILSQEVRSITTLVIGMMFYFTFASWPQDRERLRKLWQGINLGGILLVFWAALQVIFILRGWDGYPAWMQSIQSLLVIKSPQVSIITGRIHGLTYEASWFAHQLVILYLPLWFAATYQRTSAFKFRLFRLTLENILLLVGLIEFFFSSPRVGMISFLLLVGYLYMMVNISILRRIIHQITNHPSIKQRQAQRPIRVIITSVVSMLFFTTYIVLLAGAFYLSSRRDWRLSFLLSYPISWEEILGILALREDILLNLSLRLAFMERMIYWIAGWRIFQLHPWLGVGPGNAGFFFLQEVPFLGWASVEIRSLLYRLKAFPNIKSFWVRLTAETGLVGFSVFLTWLFLLFNSARLSLHGRDPVIKTLALAGQLGLIAFIGEGFSIDSFAMPYLWIVAGLISATGLIYRKEMEGLRQVNPLERPEQAETGG